MATVEDYFYIEVTPDKLVAYLCYHPKYKNELIDINITEKEIIDLLKKQKITYGIKYNDIKKLTEKINIDEFPLLIAEGLKPIDGKRGEILYVADMTTEIDRTEGWDFREVMKIPSVEKGDKLATIILPEKGMDGKSVFNTLLRAKHGKPVKLRAGKNVVYDQTKLTFYAAEDGELNITADTLNVYSLYEVREDISLKTGNIDFVGSVNIHGNVPSGYTIKAVGDIKIYGIVEAANIIAGGSVFVTEGMAGLKKGNIEANENVYIGYVNQGNIIAGNNIIVENSILHSYCSATNDIVCQRGSVIGGETRAGRIMKMKNIGNRMYSETNIIFDTELKQDLAIKKLKSTKLDLEDNLKKINILINKMQIALRDSNNAKTRATLSKLSNSKQISENQLREINEQLKQLEGSSAEKKESHLEVEGKIYPNVIIGFSKYKRKLNREYERVLIRVIENEITIINRT